MSYTSSAASSRRQSMMLPPAIPIGGSIGGALGSPGFAPASYGSDIGPGPQRHPKPLTAADLHLQLEREQEAVVNRLTRELAALRAQQSPNALEEPPTPTANSPIMHHNYSSPHLPRHHRTGSNTSTSATGGGVGPNTLSRQNSTRSVRSVNTGGRSSPAIGDLLPLPPHTSLAPAMGGGSGTYPYAGYYGYQYQGGLGIATPSANGSMVDLSGSNTEHSLAETIKWRNELENAKRENEVLRKRIKELEKTLKEAAGVEPEGWNGGSVSGMSGVVHSSRDRRSRSSSISLKERGRREKRPGDERGGPRKEDGEKSCDVEAKKPVEDAPTAAASAVSPEKTGL